MNFYAGKFLAIPRLLYHPFADPKVIQRYRNRQLRLLVTHAYRYVPYYRRLFSDAGITPKDIRTIDDLKFIPVTSRNDLQELPEDEIVSRGIDSRSLIVRKTSGATGEMVVIRRTWFEERLLQAFRHRAMHALGGRMRDRVVSVISTHSLHPSDNQILLAIANKFGLYRSSAIDCKQSFDNIFGSMEVFRPDVLTGYPGVLSQLARTTAVMKNRKVRPRFVVTDSEVLTPLMRKRISETFSAPVYDLYDSHEFNLIACECPETGEYHLNDDGVIIEVLRDGKPVKNGERGEVVGTNLHSFASPFIRYRLGDIATKGESTCRCGKPYATIRSIQGRMLDYFTLPGGKLIHPYEIISKLRNSAFPGVRQYQLLQEREDRIVMNMIPIDALHPPELGELENGISRFLGNRVRFHVRLVGNIEFEPSGKFRVARSLLKSDYDDIHWNREADTDSAK